MENKDEETRDELLARFQMTSEELVQSLARHHKENEQCREMECAIWLNAKADVWSKGIDLLEILPEATYDPNPDFRHTLLGSNGKWPKLRLIWSNPKDFETGPGREYSRQLAEKFASGDAKVVYRDPDAKLNVDGLDALMSAPA